jgi:hypothetical protein
MTEPGKGKRSPEPLEETEAVPLTVKRIVLDDVDESPAPEPVVKVKVRAPFQVVYETVVYLPGAVVEVPESLSQEWLTNSWVEST